MYCQAKPSIIQIMPRSSGGGGGGALHMTTMPRFFSDQKKNPTGEEEGRRTGDPQKTKLLLALMWDGPKKPRLAWLYGNSGKCIGRGVNSKKYVFEVCFMKWVNLLK